MEIFKVNSNSTKNSLKLAPLALAVALSSGCGSPDDPDEGTKLASSAVSGVAIDGYLAGATVYADLNDDGKRNPGEPSAETDGEGYFSSSKEGINYCDNPATEHFCLRLSGVLPESVTLRVYGGLDLYTSQSFVGELSASVSPGEEGVIRDEFITPITSLLSGQDSADASALLLSLGLDETQLASDFLGAATADQEVASIAYQLHKVAVIFTNVFEDTYDFFGEESAFPRAASKLIYGAFSDHLRGGGSLDSSGLSTIFEKVDQAIVDLHNDNLDEDDDNQTISSGVSSTDRSEALANATSILNIIQAAVPQDETSLDAASMRARLTGIDVVVSKMIDDGDDGDALDLAGLLEEALVDGERGPLFDFLDTAGEIDFRTLLGIDYTGASIDYGSAAISGGITFENLGGQELSFEYSDTKDDGYSVNGAALVLFQAVSGEGESLVRSSGDLKLCLRYQDTEPERDEDNDQQFERDDEDELVYSPMNTEGLLFDTGDWKTVGDRTVDLAVLNGLKIKITSKGAIETEEGTKNLLDFFYNEDGETWETGTGLSTSGSSSTLDSNEDCAAALEARYGALPNLQ